MMSVEVQQRYLMSVAYCLGGGWRVEVGADAFCLIGDGMRILAQYRDKHFYFSGCLSSGVQVLRGSGVVTVQDRQAPASVAQVVLDELITPLAKVLVYPGEGPALARVLGLVGFSDVSCRLWKKGQQVALSGRTSSGKRVDFGVGEGESFMRVEGLSDEQLAGLARYVHQL